MDVVCLPETKEKFHAPFVSDHSPNFNMKTALRILSILIENGRINKTVLAKKVGLNYDICIKYVDILLMLDWVRPIFDGYDYLVITVKAREFVNQLSTS